MTYAALIPEILSALLSAGAAYMWWKSTTVAIPTTFPVHVYNVGGMPGSGGGYVGYGQSPEITELGRGLGEQSKWNKWAAGCAAATAAVQTIVIVCKAVDLVSKTP